jgi:lipopolysaccharide biosynthesis glycosyltransferase
MNLNAMRRDNIVKLMIENAGKLGDKFIYQDQDLINFSLRRRIKTLDARFNWNHEFHEKYPQQTCKAVISHFSGPAKPWSVNRICYHSAKDHYFYYLEKTPYRNFIKRYRRERPYKCIIPYLIEIIKFILPKRILNLIRHVRDKYRYGESIFH